MKKKKLLALLLIVCMTLGIVAFTACNKGGDNPPPAEKTAEEKLIDGRFAYGYEVPPNDKKNTTGFFRFYDTKPGIGKVFYAYLSGTVFGGTYTLEETDCAYSVYFNRDDAVTDNGKTDERQVKDTAPYTISFYDFYGNSMGKSGFDGDYLYHNATDGSATEKVYAQGMGPIRFTRDTGTNTYKDNSGNDIYGYETLMPAVLCNYINNDDKASTIEIYHNLTYSDLVNTAIDGTWTLAVASGVKTFTLTPDAGGNTAYSLVIAANGITAVYNAGSTAINMTRASDYVSEVTTLTTAERLSGSVTGPGDTVYDVTYEYILTLYDDGSCKLVRETYMTSKIATSTIDTGTWEKKAGKVEFTFEEAGALEAAISDDTITLNYTDGDIGTAVLEGDASAFEKSVVKELTGEGKRGPEGDEDGDFVLYLYDDGTCELFWLVSSYSVSVDSGTYVLGGFNNLVPTCTFDSAGVIAAELRNSYKTIELDYSRNDVVSVGNVTVTVVMAGPNPG